MPPLRSWLIAFLLTVAIELPVVVALLRVAEPSLRRRAALGVFAQLLSHPLVWFVFPQLPMAPEASLALSELWALGSECVFYAVALPRLRPARALLLALLANGASFGLGEVLRAFGLLL